jgi:uncharacterized membrane protein YbhN (UPF0104 family)
MELRAPRRRLARWIGVAALAVSLGFIATSIDARALARTASAALDEPVGLALAVGAFALAFAVRAWVWTRVAPGLPFGHALAAIHVSLGANHVLPLRLGEVMRVTSVVRRTNLSLAAATASTAMLRASDILAVVGLAALFGPRVAERLAGQWAWLLLAPAGALLLGGLWWLRGLGDSKGLHLRRAVPLVVATATSAWLLESVMMLQAARWAGLDVAWSDAVLVTAVTIVAQVVAIAPAGIGTYEAAASAAFVALGFDASIALAAALTAHAIKTVYSLVGGGVALFVPAPGAFGRLRLPAAGESPEGRPRPGASVHPDDPVVLFMPAHNEAASIQGVVARAPRSVAGHPVTILVIDDGSEDDTAARAANAGAEVLSLGRNRGLGFAVGCGLQEAARRNACAVAFCDADGEYAPEELERVIDPILEGRADYVVGSRMRGNIGRMLPHRKLGNILLTRMLRFIARRPISDGQSGYRAFSREAAAGAEIVHDFNYAQVLTLDLLAKGYRYAEVPISYGFRESGESFVRLGRYLRHVLPAIHAELNSGESPAASPRPRAG